MALAVDDYLSKVHSRILSFDFFNVVLTQSNRGGERARRMRRSVKTIVHFAPSHPLAILPPGTLLTVMVEGVGVILRKVGGV